MLFEFLIGNFNSIVVSYSVFGWHPGVDWNLAVAEADELLLYFEWGSSLGMTFGEGIESIFSLLEL